jgi:hypothetical protein
MMLSILTHSLLLALSIYMPFTFLPYLTVPYCNGVSLSLSEIRSLGFTSKTSYFNGETVKFKIDVLQYFNSSRGLDQWAQHQHGHQENDQTRQDIIPWHQLSLGLEIYRLGYYGGDGARLISTVPVFLFTSTGEGVTEQRGNTSHTSGGLPSGLSFPWPVKGVGEAALSGGHQYAHHSYGSAAQQKLHENMYRHYQPPCKQRRVLTSLYSTEGETSEGARKNHEKGYLQSIATDCDTWHTNAVYDIPHTSITGIYLAVPVITLHKHDDRGSKRGSGDIGSRACPVCVDCNYGGFGGSGPACVTLMGHSIPFVVKHRAVFPDADQDGKEDYVGGGSDMNVGNAVIFKTSDYTWQAYNKYGNRYVGCAPLLLQ